MSAIDPNKLVKAFNELEKRVNQAFDHAVNGEAIAKACQHYISAMPAASEVNLNDLLAKTNASASVSRDTAELHRQMLSAIRQIHQMTQKGAETQTE